MTVRQLIMALVENSEDLETLVVVSIGEKHKIYPVYNVNSDPKTNNLIIWPNENKQIKL